MSPRFAVVGCGIQGAAAAYDLLQFSSSPVTLADTDPDRLTETHRRLIALEPAFGERLATAVLNVEEPVATRAFLLRHEILVSALPYRLHPRLQNPAIELGRSVVDMGCDTDDVLALTERDREAQANGAILVTDAGLAPGLVNLFASSLMEHDSGVRRVRAYCGGLPKSPHPPLNYALRFSLESLIGEYEDDAFELHDGRVTRVSPLTDLEEIEFPGVGTLEAFVTSGGSGTAPFTFFGRLETYAYKTLRYPGHCQAMRLLRDLGFWGADEIGSGVTARAATMRVLERALADETGEDVVLVKVAATLADGTERALFLNEGRDPATGFTAMERLTGFSTAIVAHAVAEGRVRTGVVPCESAMPGADFVRELARRGIKAWTG